MGNNKTQAWMQFMDINQGEEVVNVASKTEDVIVPKKENFAEDNANHEYNKLSSYIKNSTY